MAEMTPRTLSGFMELLPKPQQQMERMMDILRRTYSLYGFTPLDTPVIEAAEVLLAKGGGETEKQIYRFNKGDADLALRFDLTVPLAKYVALHYNDLSFPFRRYQIGKVYRGERAQRGRFREFYQADIDVIGDGKLDITNEAEMPAIIYRAFSELGLRRFCIRVNNRKILNGFYAMLGLTDKAGDIMRTVDKLDKIGAEKVRALLTDEVGVSAESADEILKFIAITGSNDQVLSALEGYAGRNETFDEGLDQLKTVVKYLSAFGVPEENFAVDLTIARGLDYYTGTVYETALLDHPEIGSVCSGGCADPAHDRGPVRRRHTGHKAAGRRRADPAVHRAKKVQGQDELRRQDRRALCGVPGRGRGEKQRHCLQGYDQRRADHPGLCRHPGADTGRPGREEQGQGHRGEVSALPYGAKHFRQTGVGGGVFDKQSVIIQQGYTKYNHKWEENDNDADAYTYLQCAAAGRCGQVREDRGLDGECPRGRRQPGLRGAA